MHLEVILTDKDYSEDMYANNECRDVLNSYREYYPSKGYHPPWIGYFIIDENKVKGCCGFTGVPENGRVELAYYTFKPFEGRGIASFACTKMIEIVKEADSSFIIIAKTKPEKNASTRILEKNGFVFSAVVQDHEIGDAWEWMLNKID